MFRASAVLVLLISVLAMPAYSDIGADFDNEGSARQLQQLPQGDESSGGRGLLQTGQRTKRRQQGGRGLLQNGKRLERLGGRGLLQTSVTETYVGPNGRAVMDSITLPQGNKPAKLTLAFKGLQKTAATKTYTLATTQKGAKGGQQAPAPAKGKKSP